MTHKHLTDRFSFGIASTTRLLLAISLVINLLWGANAQQPRATANTQSGFQAQSATVQDQRRIVAQRKFEEGEALHAQRTAESLRMAVKKYEEALLLYRAIGDREEEAPLAGIIGTRLYPILVFEKGTADRVSSGRNPFPEMSALCVHCLPNC